MTAAGDLAGGFGVSPWMVRPLADRVAERFLARVVTLPAPTRRLLLLAAAEPLGDPGLLKRAADRQAASPRPPVSFRRRRRASGSVAGE